MEIIKKNRKLEEKCMGYVWISETCVVNCDEKLICNGERTVKVRKQCWTIMAALIEARRENRILTREQIGERLWPGAEGGYDEGRRGTLRKAVDELEDAIGEDVIERKEMGYCLKNPIKEGDTATPFYIAYYEALWSRYCMAEIREGDGSKSRELADIYVLPKFRTINGESGITAPLAGTNIKKVVTAGSGIGKTMLMQSVILSGTVDALYKHHSPELSENTLHKKEQGFFEKIRMNLFGEKDTEYLPVYIPAKKANLAAYESIMELAEFHGMEGFEEFVKQADKENRLLILIDSIDEIEQEKTEDFLPKLADLAQDYPGAGIVITTRFSGKAKLPLRWDYLLLSEFDENAIETLVKLTMSEQGAEKALAEIKGNPYTFSLAKNPYMLTIMLEISKGSYPINHLQSIVNAIIERRWKKDDSIGITTEALKQMLGYIACSFIFGGKKSVERKDIGILFLEAKESIVKKEEYKGMFDISNQTLDSFVRMLSSKSGILNLKEEAYIEWYEFQDELVMCYLASEYFMRMASDKMKRRKTATWENTAWINKFVHSFSENRGKEVLSENALLVFVMAISTREFGTDYQMSVLYFLLFQDALSFDEEERKRIAVAYRDILENRIGENRIANRKDSEAYCLMERFMIMHKMEKDLE